MCIHKLGRIFEKKYNNKKTQNKKKTERIWDGLGTFLVQSRIDFENSKIQRFWNWKTSKFNDLNNLKIDLKWPMFELVFLYVSNISIVDVYIYIYIYTRT